MRRDERFDELSMISCRIFLELQREALARAVHAVDPGDQVHRVPGRDATAHAPTRSQRDLNDGISLVQAFYCRPIIVLTYHVIGYDDNDIWLL